MVVRLRSWWRKIKQHRVAIGVGTIVVVVVTALIIAGYQFDWTGFNGNNKSGKTLWDWMQLLFIPVVLAVAGFWFNHNERRAAEFRAYNERKAADRRAEAERRIEEERAKTDSNIAEDNRHEAALQEYINNMSELLLHENLRTSESEDEVRKVARVRTLTVLNRLDGLRKGSVLQFLYESGLISTDKPIIDLNGANFDDVDLTSANLRQANLQNVILVNANLSDCDLTEANLFHTLLSHATLVHTKLVNANLSFSLLVDTDLKTADLHDAFLANALLNRANLRMTNLQETDLSRAQLTNVKISNANLRGANLNDADLFDAEVTNEQLNQAKSLKGATMPDGTKHQ